MLTLGLIVLLVDERRIITSTFSLGFDTILTYLTSVSMVLLEEERYSQDVLHRI